MLLPLFAAPLLNFNEEIWTRTFIYINLLSASLPLCLSLAFTSLSNALCFLLKQLIIAFELSLHGKQSPSVTAQQQKAGKHYNWETECKRMRQIPKITICLCFYRIIQYNLMITSSCYCFNFLLLEWEQNKRTDTINIANYTIKTL